MYWLWLQLPLHTNHEAPHPGQTHQDKELQMWCLFTSSTFLNPKCFAWTHEKIPLCSLLTASIKINWPLHCKLFSPDLSSQVLSLMVRVGHSWQCSVCEYQSAKKGNMFEHVEAKHIESPGYECSTCGVYCKTYSAFRSHHKRQHRQWYDSINYFTKWNWLLWLLILQTCRLRPYPWCPRWTMCGTALSVHIRV